MLVDEAHRTTGGDLGNYLMGALPNATYIGFTGTPIDRSAHGQGHIQGVRQRRPRDALPRQVLHPRVDCRTARRFRCTTRSPRTTFGLTAETLERSS